MDRARGLRGFIGLCRVFCFGLLLSGSGEAQTFFTDVTEEAVGILGFYARGSAFGDYDNDGRPDVFLPENGGAWPMCSLPIMRSGWTTIGMDIWISMWGTCVRKMMVVR